MQTKDFLKAQTLYNNLLHRKELMKLANEKPTIRQVNRLKKAKTKYEYELKLMLEKDERIEKLELALIKHCELHIDDESHELWKSCFEKHHPERIFDEHWKDRHIN